MLISGSTGFLAKVLVEKLLREQPDAGTLYLLVQPRGGLSGAERVARMLAESPVFGRLREMHGEAFGERVAAKLVAVEGNIGEANLGLSPEDLARVQAEVSVVVNSAATTAFDERYDVAVNVNTLGPGRVLEVARGCERLELLLHVSTAFVNGLRRGVAPEQPFAMGDCIAQELGWEHAPALDVDAEVARAQGAAADFCGSRAGNETALAAHLQELGSARAAAHGWQDTYVFTKAMGEMLLGRQHGEVPVAIVRPSIVESALSEPYAGWVEGIRMCDPIVIAYGKGQLRGFVGDADGVLDVVPVDHVVNAMLAAMPRHARTAGEHAHFGDDAGGADGGIAVYQVATGTANPLGNRVFVEQVTRHFLEHPMADKTGAPIRPGAMAIFRDERAFLRDSWLRYRLPLQLAALLPWRDAARDRRRAAVLDKVFAQLGYLAKIYRDYTFYECRFDSRNTAALLGGLDAEEQEAFNFDASRIDWAQYLGDTHVRGLRKYVLKRPVGDRQS